MKSNSAVSSEMTGDGPGVVADQRELAARPQNQVMVATPPNTYYNASLPTRPALVSDSDAVLASPVNVMFAGPVMQTTNVVSEVELGPNITVGSVSPADFKLIMSLVVIEEEH